MSLFLVRGTVVITEYMNDGTETVNETRLVEAENETDCSSAQCDECDQPSAKTIRDASGILHWFCAHHWDEHVAFTGNDGKPYGF